MKLSEAGLLSSLVVPQCSQKLRDSKNRVCYLGGALVSIGAINLDDSNISEEEALYARLSKEWPILRKRLEKPKCGVPHTDTHLIGWTSKSVMEIIWSLNDTMKWTRPQISAWVATIEDEDEAEKAVQAAKVAIATVEAPTSTYLLDVACKG